MKTPRHILTLLIAMCAITASAQWFTIPTGEYIITSGCDPRFAIDYQSGQTSDGTNVHCWEYNGSEAQVWLIYGMKISPALNYQSAIDNSSSIVADGNNIQLWGENRSDAQKWLFKHHGGDLYSIHLASNTDYVIDLSGSGTTNGNNIHLWRYNGTNAQLWHIKPRPAKARQAPVTTAATATQPQQQAQQSSGPITFYPTHWMGANGQYDVYPANNTQHKLNVTFNSSHLDITGSSTPYRNQTKFTFQGTNSDGSLKFVGELPVSVIIFYSVVNISPDGKYMSYEFYTANTYGRHWSSTTYYTSDLAERERIIAQNQPYVRGASIPPSTGSSSGNSNSSGGQLNLRYPEYQRYLDQNGNFNERQYNADRRANCRVCHGTGINPYPDTSYPGHRSATYNSAGTICNICGKSYEHHHDRCSSCTP